MHLHHAPIVQFAISGTGGRRNLLPSGPTTSGSPLVLLLLGRMLDETILEKKRTEFAQIVAHSHLYFPVVF
jgi:hypothetical protein